MPPWYVQRPGLFARERGALAQAYPELILCEEEMDRGKVVFQGTLQGPTPAGLGPISLRLVYPNEFPYLPPRVIPVLSNASQPDTRPTAVRFFSARHQMADGALCLFEHEAVVDPRLAVGGEQALLRSEQWFRAVAAGRLPPGLDSPDAELEAHYDRLGDVLLGPMLFEESSGGGRLVLAALGSSWRDERYPILVVPQLEATSLANDRTLLEKIGFRRPDDFWCSFPKGGTHNLVVRWYGLAEEPPPIRTVEALASLLFPNATDPFEAFKRDVLRDALSRNAVDVPLRYPKRSGGFDWLFLRIPLRERSLQDPQLPMVNGVRGQVLDWDGGETLKRAPIGHLRVHDLRPTRLLIRNRNRIPAEAATLSFGVAGVGALGSTCADLLAKAGVGSLRLFDPSFLNAGNAIRHLADVTAAGVPKAFLVGALANAHNPHCAISSEHTSVLDASDDDPLWTSNAILSAIADDGMELALNRRALERTTTVYYLRAFRGGTVGMLFRAGLPSGGCFECLLLRWSEGDPDVPAIPAAEEEVIGRECGQPILASSAADLAVVAGLGVRQMLSSVSRGGEENLWIWAVDGIEGHPTLSSPFSRVCVRVPPHPACPACSRRGLAKMEIPRRIHEQMVRLARADAPNETGGILVGRADSSALRVEAVSDAGPKASKSPAQFERDGDHCQRFLREAVAQGTGLAYLGEWHSHPASSARPSPRDIDSMLEIADDEAYASPSPLLVIVGLGDGKQAPELSATLFFRGGDAALPVAAALVDEATARPSSNAPQTTSTASFEAVPSAQTEKA